MHLSQGSGPSLARCRTRGACRAIGSQDTAGYTRGMATTIKVSAELRDRINREARERGMTAAGLIEGLLDAYERRERMEAFGRAVRGADREYWDESREWDVSLSDGQNGQ